MKYKEILAKNTKRALITGGTSGIGKSFSHRLAKDGFHLTIIARRESLLSSTLSELERQYSAKVQTISADLSDQKWRKNTELNLSDYDLIINCAGDGYPGEFGTQDIEMDRQMLQLNCTTPMELTHEAIPYLKAKGGGIILVSSTMGFIGVPMMANYSATKSYLISFGEALYQELKEYNVSVEVLTPGATRTPGADKYEVNYDELPVKWMNPEEVVSEALKNLGKKPIVIPGWTNWLTAGMSNCILTRGKLQMIMKKFSKRIIKTS